jgi:MurNAc alpha-1-phosphate uridylyltransferase
MRAMILAAGCGERMGDLTNSLPKPLLVVKGKPLIEWHLENLSKSGFREVVINVSYLPEKIKEFVGDGSRWQLSVVYSEENSILETAGGIKKAIPLLGSKPFIVINADIYSNFVYRKLKAIKLNENVNAYLILVKNPEHNKKGDFGLLGNSDLTLNNIPFYTFSGIAVYHSNFFNKVKDGEKIKLLPLIEDSISRNLIKGELFEGIWSDIGTPLRLEEVNKED